MCLRVYVRCESFFEASAHQHAPRAPPRCKQVTKVQCFLLTLLTLVLSSNHAHFGRNTTPHAALQSMLKEVLQTPDDACELFVHAIVDCADPSVSTTPSLSPQSSLRPALLCRVDVHGCLWLAHGC